MSGSSFVAVLFGRAPGALTHDVANKVVHDIRAQSGDVDVVAGDAAKLDLEQGRVVEVSFESRSSLEQLRSRSFLTPIEERGGCDIVIQPQGPRPRPIRLAVFDMDSTLIQQEVIDLLAAQAGVEPQVADITARAMNGELDFSASLRERVALLKGIPDTVFEALRPQLTITSGAELLLRCLRASGAKTALLSGGFMPLATYIAGKLGIDHVHANELAVEDGRLTGQLLSGCIIVNAERKQELLYSIAQSEGIANTAEIMAVGDGANDLLMLGAAGLGIAVNAKPRVQERAPYRLNCKSLVDVLYALGYHKDEIDAIPTK